MESYCTNGNCRNLKYLEREVTEKYTEINKVIVENQTRLDALNTSLVNHIQDNKEDFKELKKLISHYQTQTAQKAMWRVGLILGAFISVMTLVINILLKVLS